MQVHQYHSISSLSTLKSIYLGLLQSISCLIQHAEFEIFNLILEWYDVVNWIWRLLFIFGACSCLLGLVPFAFNFIPGFEPSRSNFKFCSLWDIGWRFYFALMLIIFVCKPTWSKIQWLLMWKKSRLQKFMALIGYKCILLWHGYSFE